MFEDSFADMLQRYPEAVHDRKRFVGLMKDCFPDQQMQVNLVNTAFDLGIVDELEKARQINNTFAFRFVKRLLDEYGISRVNADWVISVWCVCYGKKALHKPCDIEISRARTGAAPSIRDEQGTGSGRQYNDLFQYRAVSDGYGICGFSGANCRTLIVPNMHQGRPITRILADAFEGSDVQEVVMTDGITVMEEAAFRNCRSLKQVIFAESLREIGDYVFSGCKQLVTAAFPRSLEQIGRYAFEGTALRQADLPNSLLWIGEGAFKECTRLSAVHLPGHITEIPEELFKGCGALKRLEVSRNIQAIGKEAFAECDSLMDLMIPDSVTTVGENAFRGADDSFRLICTLHSATEQYARKHNVTFQIVE